MYTSLPTPHLIFITQYGNYKTLSALATTLTQALKEIPIDITQK